MQENLYSWRDSWREHKKEVPEPLYSNYSNLLNENRAYLLKYKHLQLIKENNLLEASAMTAMIPVGTSEAQPKKPKTQKGAIRKCTTCNNANCSLRTCTSCSKEVCAAIKCQTCQNWFCNQQKADCILKICDYCKRKCCMECAKSCNEFSQKLSADANRLR
jgi:hypothetical protein